MHVKPDSTGNAMRPAPLALALTVALTATNLAAAARDARQHAPAHPANDIQVENCNDSGPGSLRDAVAHASDEGEIALQDLTCSTITLTTGAIVVGVDGLYIAAAGAFPRAAPPARVGDATNGYEPHIVTIDGGGSDRIFDHTGGDGLYLQGLALRNGYASGDGGCVRSAGNVTLALTTISGCRAHDADYNHGRGGGVFAAADVHAFSSTISGNRADGSSPHGGGVFAGHDATLVSTRVADNTASGYLPIGGGVFAGHMLDATTSTISGNTAFADRVNGQGPAGGAYARNLASVFQTTIASNRADDVGGLFVIDSDSATAQASAIALSTISGNQGGSIGGALVSRAALKVYGSTIANNTATHGGGAGGLVVGADAIIVSSIVATNSAAGAPSDIGLRNGAPPATTIVGDHNLIVASTIAPPPDTIAQPPLLGPLADNGGPTLTHALLAGSPAIDHGSNPDAFTYDQRGYARKVGASADIGAFEFAPLPDNIFCDGFDDDWTACMVD